MLTGAGNFLKVSEEIISGRSSYPAGTAKMGFVVETVRLVLRSVYRITCNPSFDFNQHFTEVIKVSLKENEIDFGCNTQECLLIKAIKIAFQNSIIKHCSEHLSDDKNNGIDKSLQDVSGINC